MLLKILELAWRFRTLVLLALLVLVSLLAVGATRALQHEHARAEQIDRDRKAELARALDEMEHRNAKLAAQLEKLRKEHGKIEPTSVAHVETTSVPANPGAAPIPKPSAGAPAGSSTPPPCLFDASSRGRLVLDSAEVVDHKGSRWNVLGVSAQRTYPEPQATLFSDGLVIPLAPVSTVAPSPAPAPARPRLTLSLRAGWDPSDLRARPVLAGELAYRLLSFWRLDLSGYASTEEHYGTWSGRGGVQVTVGLH